MAFGIIPENPALGIDQHWDVGLQDYTDSIRGVLNRLDVSYATRCKITEPGADENNMALAGVTDLLGLVAPFLPVDGLSMVNYRTPFRSHATGIFYHFEGKLVARNRLNEMMPPPASAVEGRATRPPRRHESDDVLHWVRDVINSFKASYSIFFNACHTTVAGIHATGYTTSERTQRCLTHLSRTCSEVDVYLREWIKDYDGILSYSDLVGVHIEMAINIHSLVWDLQQKKECDGFRDGTGAFLFF